MRKFINQKMYAAWNQWRSWAAEMRRQQKMMGGAVRRMIYRKLSMAWEQWQAVYEDLKFANRMGGGAIRRMLNRKLSMAWEKWQYEAAEAARQEELSGGCSTGSCRWRGRSGSMRQQKQQGRRSYQEDAQQEAVDGVGEVAV